MTVTKPPSHRYTCSPFLRTANSLAVPATVCLPPDTFTLETTCDPHTSPKRGARSWTTSSRGAKDKSA